MGAFINGTSLLIGDTVRSVDDGRSGVIITPDNINIIVGPGAVTVTQGSAAVVGTDTTFNTTFVEGSKLYIASSTYVVLSVTDDTHLTLTATVTEAFADSVPYAIDSPLSSGPVPSGLPAPPTTDTVKVQWNDQTTSVVKLSTLELVFRGSY